MRTAKSLKKKGTRRLKGITEGSFEKYKGTIPAFGNEKEINAWVAELRGRKPAPARRKH